MSLQTPPRVRPRRQRRGAAAMEFAVIAPIFFAIIFALMEFTHVWYLREAANDAAREAARSAMSYGGNTTIAKARANKVLAAVGATAVTTSFSPANITEHTTQVTVDIELPYNTNSLFSVPFFMRNATIRGSATLACEQFRAVNGLYARPT